MNSRARSVIDHHVADVLISTEKVAYLVVDQDFLQRNTSHGKWSAFLAFDVPQRKRRFSARQDEDLGMPSRP